VSFVVGFLRQTDGAQVRLDRLIVGSNEVRGKLSRVDERSQRWCLREESMQIQQTILDRLATNGGHGNA